MNKLAKLTVKEIKDRIADLENKPFPKSLKTLTVRSNEIAGLYMELKNRK